MPPQSRGGAHGASGIQGAPVGRDVNDGRAAANAVYIGCSVNVGTDAARAEHRQAWSACFYVLLRAALASFRPYVRPSSPSIGRLSCPVQNRVRRGAARRRRRGDGSEGEGGWGVGAGVRGDFSCRMRVPGRGLDVVGGAEVSRVLSSRGGGSTRVDRRGVSASATLRVMALCYQ